MLIFITDSVAKQKLGDTILLDGTGDGVIQRITCLGEGSLAGKFGGQRAVFGRGRVQKAYQMVSQDMFQQKVEAVAVILVTKMTQFVQKDIVLEHARQAHDAEIKVDVPL